MRIKQVRGANNGCRGSQVPPHGVWCLERRATARGECATAGADCAPTRNEARAPRCACLGARRVFYWDKNGPEGRGDNLQRGRCTDARGRRARADLRGNFAKRHASRPLMRGMACVAVCTPAKHTASPSTRNVLRSKCIIVCVQRGGARKLPTAGRRAVQAAALRPPVHRAAQPPLAVRVVCSGIYVSTMLAATVAAHLLKRACAALLFRWATPD